MIRLPIWVFLVVALADLAVAVEFMLRGDALLEGLFALLAGFYARAFYAAMRRP